MRQLEKNHLWNQGIRLFYKAGENLRGEPTEHELDLALILLSIGVEQILKQPILDCDWQLLCQKPVTKDKFDAGEFRSISGDEAVKMLRERNLYDVPSSFASTFSALCSMRNRFFHFAMKPRKEELFPVAVKIIDEIIEFQRTLYDGYLDDELRELVLQIQPFVEHRHREIRADLKAAIKKQTVLRCYSCLNVAGVFDEDNEWICLFCRAGLDFEDLLVETNVASPPNIDRQRVNYCRSIDGCCGKLLVVGIMKDDGVAEFHSFICSSCGQESKDPIPMAD
jgi:hypothetical protein